MTELQVKAKKGSLKKFLAMFLAVCVCMTTIYVNGSFAKASGESSAESGVVSPDTSTPTTPDTSTPTTPDTSTPTTPDTSTPTTPTSPAPAKPTPSAPAKPTLAPATPTPAPATPTPAPATPTPTPAPVKVTKVTLSASTLYLVTGKSVTVGAAVAPTNATNSKLTWSSNKTAIATVNNGKITAKKKTGKAVITAKAKDGSGKKATVTVNVVKKPKNATKVTLNGANVSVGESVAFTATLTPKKSTSTLTWSTSNKKVATVKNGIVTGVKAGTATITVKTDNNKKATYVVAVSKPNTTLTLKRTSGSVKVGKTVKIATKKIGKGDAVKSYTSSNKKVATVTKKGVVTGKKAGTAVITVLTKKGAVATFTVTVKKK